MTNWRKYIASIPTNYNENPVDLARFNMQSLALLNVAGGDFGWSYTNSVTRGEGTPGTAAEPLREYYYKGTGNERKWLKRVLEWTGGVITQAAFYYSEDNESTYVPMYDDDGINYVLTLVYDGSDNLVSTSWGNVP